MNKKPTIIDYDICIADTENRILEYWRKIEELEYYLAQLRFMRDAEEELKRDLPI